jgi:WD40 repeat protein
MATGGYGVGARVLNPDGKLVHTLNCGREGGLTPVFSPDGKVLAVGNRNDTTRLFDAATGKQLHLLPERMTQGIAFSPDGKTLAVAYVDGRVILWDVATGEKMQSAKSGGTEAYSVAWSPAGDVLATSGRKGKVVVWEAATLKPLKELDAGEWVISVRFSMDGSRLYTAGGSVSDKADRQVIAWAPHK